MSGVPKPGQVKDISSTSNPVVKSLRGLALKKNRDRDGMFLAEGLKLATDALAAGWVIRNLVYSRSIHDQPGLQAQVEKLAAEVRAKGGDILVATDKVMSTLTRRDNAQMVVSTIEPRFASAEQIDLIDNNLWLALDRVRDPGNLGTIIRTADCLGASGVMLIGDCTDPFGVEAVRATMGSLFHMPIVRMSQPEFITQTDRWKASGTQIVGAHLVGSVDHRAIDYSKGPQIVLMGNEQQGLTDELAASCSQLARVAMAGQADSLNLAVATGIMLIESRRHAL